MAKKEKLSPIKLLERFQFLKSKRGTWESHWQECADYILPNRNDVTTTRWPGEKRNLLILDNTPMNSAELLAGALHGLLTSPNALWFELTTGNPKVDMVDGIRAWLQETTLAMHNVLNNSNFQTEVHQYYLDLVGLCTAGMTIEEDDESVVRFATRHIREFYISENNKGRVDEVFRKFCWNIRQIVGEFGEEVLSKSKSLQRAYDKNEDTEFEIIHAVYPRTIENKNARDPRRYISQYVVCIDNGSVEIASGFYREFPWVVARWIKASGEIYGRGPGMTALPDAKTLNKMTETVLIGAQKVVDPPLQAPDDGFVLPIKTRPGGLNYYRAGSSDRIEPIFNDTRIDFGYETMQDRRRRIREAFFVDQLQLNEGPQMTATEVNQRTEERMRFLGPMLGRQQSEFLRPMIDRVFEIMARKNMISQPPEALLALGKPLDVTYSSMIAKTQRMIEGQNIARTMQAIAPFATSQPEVLDNFDGDAAVRVIAKIYGAPQEIIRNQNQIQEIRKGRAEAQEAAMMAQKEQQGVENVSKVIPALTDLEKTQQVA